MMMMVRSQRFLANLGHFPFETPLSDRLIIDYFWRNEAEGDPSRPSLRDAIMAHWNRNE